MTRQRILVIAGRGIKSMNSFQMIVKDAVENGHKEYLTSIFEVATSTVDRWISGTGCPQPRIQQLIINECSKLLNK